MNIKRKDSGIHIHSVKYNFVMNVILKISQYIFPLITLPYITRTLGAVGNGKVAFATSVITYFSMFAQLGIPSYGVRECARCRDNKDRLTKTVQELIMINSISVLFSYLFLVISMLTVEKLQEEPLLLIINSLTILLNMLGMEWLYQSLEQYQYITIRNIVFKILSVILMFLLVHNPDDYIVYGSLTVLSSGGSYIMNFLNSRKMLEHKLYFGQYNLKKHIKPILTFFALSVAVSIYTSMDTVMLGFIAGDEQVAFYSLSTKIKMVLASTISALGPVLLPRITYCLSHGQEKKFQSYIEKSMHFVLLFSIPVTIYFIVMAPQAIDILGGSEYKLAVACMQIITLAIVPLGIGNIACSQILTPMGKEKLTMYSTIFGAVINFGANMMLIPFMGAVGAALATVIAESIIACIQIHYVWNEVRSVVKNMPFFKLGIANALAFVVLESFLKVVKISNPFLDMVAAVIVFFGIYVLILILTKDSLVYQYGINYLRKMWEKHKHQDLK